MCVGLWCGMMNYYFTAIDSVLAVWLRYTQLGWQSRQMAGGSRILMGGCCSCKAGPVPGNRWVNLLFFAGGLRRLSGINLQRGIAGLLVRGRHYSLFEIPPGHAQPRLPSKEKETMYRYILCWFHGIEGPTASVSKTIRRDMGYVDFVWF
jgi:hypothetical protein